MGKRYSICTGRGKAWANDVFLIPTYHGFKSGNVDSGLEWHEVREGKKTGKPKRIKLKCEICGRRVKAAIWVCDDGCCVQYHVPPHKPKKWWRKGKKKKTSKRGRG